MKLFFISVSFDVERNFDLEVAFYFILFFSLKFSGVHHVIGTIRNDKPAIS